MSEPSFRRITLGPTLDSQKTLSNSTADDLNRLFEQLDRNFKGFSLEGYCTLLKKGHYICYIGYFGGSEDPESIEAAAIVSPITFASPPTVVISNFVVSIDSKDQFYEKELLLEIIELCKKLSISEFSLQARIPSVTIKELGVRRKMRYQLTL